MHNEEQTLLNEKSRVILLSPCDFCFFPSFQRVKPQLWRQQRRICIISCLMRLSAVTAYLATKQDDGDEGMLEWIDRKWISRERSRGGGASSSAKGAVKDESERGRYVCVHHSCFQCV